MPVETVLVHIVQNGKARFWSSIDVQFSIVRLGTLIVSRE